MKRKSYGRKSYYNTITIPICMASFSLGWKRSIEEKFTLVPKKKKKKNQLFQKSKIVKIMVSKESRVQVLAQAHPGLS